MKLLILGKNKDDKGTQLEQLAIKILRSQGYVDIMTVSANRYHYSA